MGVISKETHCGTDGQGNSWTFTTVMYESTSGDPGDYDVVLQVLVNGAEQGHVTYHYASNGKLKTQPHVRGNPNRPSDFWETPC